MMETGDMRRFLWIRCAGGKRGNVKYFEDLKQALLQFDRAALKLLFVELMKKDIRDFIPSAKPLTEEVINQQIASLTQFQNWWISCIRSGNLGFASDWGKVFDDKEEKVELDTLFSCYSLKDRKITRAQFVINLKDVLPHHENLAVEESTFVLPSYSECQAHVYKKFKLGSCAQSNVVANQKKRKKTKEQREIEKQNKKKRFDDRKQRTLHQYLKGKEPEDDFSEVHSEQRAMDFFEEMSPSSMQDLSLGSSPSHGHLGTPASPYASDNSDEDGGGQPGDATWTPIRSDSD